MNFDLRKRLGKEPLVKPPDITALEVWIKTVPGDSTVGAKFGYFPDPSGGKEPVKFRKLIENTHYRFKKDGYILVETPRIEESTVLGIYLRATDSNLVRNKGDLSLMPDSMIKEIPNMKKIWILKDYKPDPSQESFYLSWRNVYSMPKTIDLATFSLDVTKVLPDTNVRRNGSNLFSTILGLTDEKGKIRQTDQDIFRTEMSISGNTGYLVIPPWDDTISGFHPFRNPALGDINPGMYTQEYADYKDISRYQIHIPGGSVEQRNGISLGWGVATGSELVKYEGGRLDRDIDYRIDYQSGELELISKKAIAAQNVSVEYQNEAVFVPESKIFLGFRGEMKLPFISPTSFVGTSLLYQSTSSRDRVPRLGQEPYSKVLLDFNTKLDFEPEWMSKLVYLLPVAKTDVDSRLDVDFEAAHSWTRANTHDSAYVDDFEAAKQVYSLGESINTWFQASPPSYFSRSVTVTDSVDSTGKAVIDPITKNPIKKYSVSGDTSLLKNPPAWNQYWFTPLDNDKVYRVDSIAETFKNSSSQDRKSWESVLRLECTPAPYGPLATQYVKPWAGVMTYISGSFADRTKDKYFEFWASAEGGGKLYVDFGIIGEDLCISGQPPNEYKTTEDVPGIDRWDDALDLGLDTMPDSREVWWVPDTSLKSFVPWDTVKYGGYQENDNVDGVRVLNSADPGRDNWQLYDPDKPNTQRHVKGTQNSGRPNFNTEDINYDGTCTKRLNERYFRAVIDFTRLDALGYRVTGDTNYFLDPTVDPYLGPRNANGSVDTIPARKAKKWHHYRIPIGSRHLIDSINSWEGKSPSWKQIQSVRFVWTDFPDSTKRNLNTLQLSQIQFTGTQWQELRTRTASDTAAQVRGIRASTVNNFDDPFYKNELKVLDGRLDSTGSGVQKLEQSLRINFDSLKQLDTALLYRDFKNQMFNLSLYKILSVAVHGDRDYSADRVRFVIRFGADSLSYYEYRSAYLRQGWKNRCDLDIQDFADLKLAYLNNHPEDRDTMDTLISVPLASGDIVQYGIRTVRKDRQPSFANIAWVAVGVIRDSLPGSQPVAGEIWVNELKATGIKSMNGWAARMSVGTQWADFMGVKFGGAFEDGDFRRMTDAIGATENATLEANLSADWKLDKFLPSSWGVSIPLGMSASGSIARPQQKPGSDIFLPNQITKKSDGFNDLAGSAFKPITGKDRAMTRSEHFERRNITQSWITGFDKNTNDKNPLVNMTLDRTSVDYAYNYSKLTEALGEIKSDSAREKRNNAVDYIDATTTKSYTTSLKYDLSPRDPPSWTKWKPMGASEDVWLPSQFKSWEVNYLPRTIRFDLFGAEWSNTEKYTARIHKHEDTRKFKLRHGFNVDFTPVDPLLQMGYTLAIDRSLDSAFEERGEGYNGWVRFIRYNVAKTDPQWGDFTLLYGEQSRTQTSSLSLRPQFVDWLTHTADYKADFREATVASSRDPQTYLNLGVITTFTLSSSFEFGTLLRNLGDAAQNTKSLNELFDMIGKGSEKVGFRSVTFNYSASNDLKNNMMSRGFWKDTLRADWRHFLSYQLGAAGRTPWDNITGNMNDSTALGGMMQRRLSLEDPTRFSNDTRTASQDYKLATSFQIPEPIDLSFSSISFGWNRKYSIKQNALARDSGSPLLVDTLFTFPTVGVSASLGFFNKLEAVTSILQSVNISSQYNLERSLAKRAASEPEFILHHTFAPLVSADGTLKVLPVNLRYSFNYDHEVRHSNGWTKTEKNGNVISASYSIAQLTKIPDVKMFGWTFPIKGKTDISADVDISHEKRYELPNATEKDLEKEPTTEDRSLAITPKVSYLVTDNITANFKYNFTKKSGKQINNTSYIIELRVEIRF